jgi:hypothetical protein
MGVEMCSIDLGNVTAKLPKFTVNRGNGVKFLWADQVIFV